MTLRFTDGFDSYASSSDLAPKKWRSNAGTVWNATAGRLGGGAVQLGTNARLRSYDIISTPFQSNFAFWFKSTAAPSALNAVVIVYDTSLNVCGYLAFNTAGVLTLLQLAAAQVITGNMGICDGNWHWIENYCAWQGATAAKCHVDGIQQWNSGNVGSLNNSFNPALIDLAGFGNAATITIDDFSVYDNSGSSPINSDYPLGPCELDTLRATGDGVVQFSPDTGSTNYTQVNEVNGDTTHYVQDGTSGHQDLYDYADLSFAPQKIWGVMANAYCNNPGIGSKNHNQVCKNSGTTTTGTTTATPITNARTVQEPFVLDPNTGAAWASAAALNAAQWGIKVT